MVSGYRDSGTIEDGVGGSVDVESLLFVSSPLGKSMAWEDGAMGRLRCRDESSHSFVSRSLARSSLISASACSSRVNCFGGGA